MGKKMGNLFFDMFFDSRDEKKVSDFSDREEEYLYWQKYRWEFMRRDPEYQKAYIEIEPYFNNLFDSKLRDALSKCEKIYGLNLSNSLPDPKKSFEELFDVRNKLLDFKKSYKCKLFEKKLMFCIDFEKVNSINELKKQISKEIDNGLKQANIKKITKKKTDFDLILKVGDLKSKGLTHQQIAKKVTPDEFDNKNELKEPNPESATRNIGHYNESYKKLINGGYKDLKFP